MADTGKTRLAPAPPKKTPDRSTAKSQKKNEPSMKNKLGLFDLPPEIRNLIYRFAIISDEPIDVQYQKVRRRNRCRFNIPLALTLASKQLKLETQRLFLEENELRIMPEILKQRKSASLLALRRMHKKVGLEIHVLHTCWELNKRYQGDRFLFKAQLTLRKTDRGIIIDKQAYSVLQMTGNPEGLLPLEVCECRIQRMVRSYNMSTKSPDILSFLQRLKERREPPSYHAADLSITEEEVADSDFCRSCWKATRNVLYVHFVRF